MEMPTKKSLLMVDGQSIKIICGNKMKCMELSEVESPKNVEFLMALFSKTQVMKVDRVSKVSVEDILGPSARSQGVKAGGDKGNFPSPVIASSARREPPPPPSGSEQWVKSNMPSITLIDDLKIGSFHRDGIEVDQCLVLEPGKPVNLASLDRDRLASSRTLSRLMERGDVTRIPYEEAMAMLDRFNNQTVLSAHDDEARGVLASPDSRARDIAESMFSESTVLDVAIPIDLDGPDRDAGPMNEGGDSMVDIMSQIGEMAPPPRRASFRGFKRAAQ